VKVSDATPVGQLSVLKEAITLGRHAVGGSLRITGHLCHKTGVFVETSAK